MTGPSDIVIARQPISSAELDRLVQRHFRDMVKFVVDVERAVMAIGGELHADAEALLLDDGSNQDDVWGGNYYPGRDDERCIEYTSMINIRPAFGNRGMEVADQRLRERMSRIVLHAVGRAEGHP